MDRIKFTINGITYSVGQEVSSDVTLLDYIRNSLELRGTKYMCRQAGCGACIIAAKTPGGPLQAVNSCMVSITSCENWEIQTIEELGNRKKGYHVIQKTLASHNGSQCGHCSPGWVMSMYCLLNGNKDLTMLEIEKSFASNICRCTGYRPILEAFKTFAKDSPKIIDIEDLNICGNTGNACNKKCYDNKPSETEGNKCRYGNNNQFGKGNNSDSNEESLCTKTESDDEDWYVITNSDITDNQIKSVALKDGRKWFRVNSVADILQVFRSEGTDSFMLVGGNTAKGAYPILEYPRILIDINAISELKKVVIDQNLIIGSGVTLTELLNIYKSMSQKSNFEYLEEFYNHLEKVAHIAVRNLGTIGGNLMIKYRHNEFQSDLYLMFQTVGATLTILSDQSTQKYVTMEQFLNTDMRSGIILNVRLPPLGDDVKIKTYKVMPRSQNAHAVVNFGGLYNFQSTRNCGSLMQCKLVFGGLKSGFTRALKTEGYLVGKPLFRNETLQEAVKILENELTVTEFPSEPSSNYRKRLAIGLFYKVHNETNETHLHEHCSDTQNVKYHNKVQGVAALVIITLRLSMVRLAAVPFKPEHNNAYTLLLSGRISDIASLLHLCPANILNKHYKSGATRLHDARPVSTAKRSYETKPALWPLTQPIPKLEALIQCAGEAFYSEDIPKFPREVFGDLVLSTIAKGTIISINTASALKYPGVLAVYTAKDIPGLNSFTPADDILYTLNEEVLCSSEVKYFNQPIAIVVAEIRHIAELATKLVTVKYKNLTKPVLDIKVAKKDPNRVQLLKRIDATDRGNDEVRIVKGSNTIYGQYHFSIETIACIVRPTEEGLEVYVTTHWPDALQIMISRALNIDENRIDVHVRRCGGSFGIKISRSILVAVATSLVVTKLNRPCRFIQSMQTVTRAFGKRFPCSSDYEFGVNNSGVIQYANHSVFEDNGYTINEKLATLGISIYFNCYDKSRWNFSIYDAKTDTAKNTWFRAPGTLENIAMTEMIMEQISYELSLDPIQVRLANLDSQFSQNLNELLNTMLVESQYMERRIEVQRFNTENRWKKRGLRFVPMRWTHNYGRIFDVNLSVYHGDGTVSIVHGGVEIGQGINTRVAQIAAYFLQIPLDKIQVKAYSTISTPNSTVTGGSVTNEYVGLGVERCCKALLTNLEPTRLKMNNPTWQELITQAYTDSVDLQTHGFVGQQDKETYDIYGVAFAEVEIDVLTGEVEIRRVDVMEDAGQSLSPELDIGQVEGAFVMGIGYWTMEHLVYDQSTGELLTDRPWNYYVPQATDIPQDFRVYLRKKSFGNQALLGSKAIGEPPMCMSIVTAFAIREAVTAARADSGIPTTTWFGFDGPLTTEAVCLTAATRTDEFKFC